MTTIVTPKHVYHLQDGDVITNLDTPVTVLEQKQVSFLTTQLKVIDAFPRQGAQPTYVALPTTRLLNVIPVQVAASVPYGDRWSAAHSKTSRMDPAPLAPTTED